LSSKNSGAPTGAGAMAQAPDYAKAYGDAAMKAAQLRLIDSQARKTSAEATIAENHENQSKVESELYGSGVGMIPVATKAIGPYASKAAAAIGSSARSAYRISPYS
jgi:hypothetical protein